MWVCPWCHEQWPDTNARGKARRACGYAQCHGAYGGALSARVLRARKAMMTPDQRARANDLTPRQVLTVRHLHRSGRCVSEIARTVGIHRRTVHAILRREWYRWVR